MIATEILAIINNLTAILPIIALRNKTNQMIDKFNYEDLKTIAEMLGEQDFFTTFDFYHHVDSHTDYYCKFFGFEWTFENGRKRFFKFLVLPFGLATACYIFTKLLRPLVKNWRSLGIKSEVYLDDGISGHSSYERSQVATEQILKDITEAGFVVNFEKSNLEPKHEGEWLGTIINNTKNMTFYIPERKIEKVLKLLQSTRHENLTNAKTLSKMAGQLSSSTRSNRQIIY